MNTGSPGIPANYESLPDEQLVRLAQDGDTDAWAALLTRHYHEFKSFAHALCKDPCPSDAEDLLHDSLRRASLKLNTLRDPRSFLNWVKTIIRRKVYAWIRRRKELPTDSDELENLVEAYAGTGCVPTGPGDCDYAEELMRAVPKSHKSSPIIAKFIGAVIDEEGHHRRLPPVAHADLYA